MEYSYVSLGVHLLNPEFKSDLLLSSCNFREIYDIKYLYIMDQLAGYRGNKCPRNITTL